MPGTSPGMDAQPLHPVLQNAAEGILPEWANASVARRTYATTCGIRPCKGAVGEIAPIEKIK